MRRLRVLHIAPHLAQGGAERLLRHLAGLDDGRFAHQVVLMQDEVFFDRRGLNITSLGFDLSSRSKATTHLLSGARILRRIVRDQRPDVIQGWLYYGALLTLFVGNRAVPTVWSIHNTTLPTFKAHPLLAAVDRVLSRTSGTRPARIVYCAHAAKRVHEANGYDPQVGTVIDNGIDVSVFRPDGERRALMRAELGLPPGAFAVGLFGRFDPQKDIPGCLDAFSQARSRHPDLVLLLAGRGMDGDNPELDRWLSERQLTPHCKRLGSCTSMESLVNASDAVMLGSSYGEAMPLVLLEALASHVPVATTNVGDVDRLAIPAPAVVMPGNPTLLAEALSFVRMSAGTEIWGPAFKLVRERFSVERFVADHGSLYDALVSRDAGSGGVP